MFVPRPWSRRPALLLALWLLTRPAAGDAPAKTPLAVDDLYRLDGPRSVVLFPDGRRAVFVRTWNDPATRQERHALWLVDGEGKARPMEPGESDGRAPVVSPDGRWVAFVSTRPRPAGGKPLPPTPAASDPATDVWVLPTAGGPARPLAGPDRPHGRVFNDGFYGRLAFAPDGTRLAYVADDGADPRSPAEVTADVAVDRPDQGEGYTGYGPAQVWVAHLDPDTGAAAARRIERLTRDDVWYGDPQWTPDGRTLVVHANKTKEREAVRFSINRDYDLWALDAATGRPRRLTTGPGPEVSPRVSPDGTHVVCLSIPRKGSHRDVFNLAVVPLAEAGSPMRVLFDHHAPGAGKAPHLPPAFPLPDDCWDGVRAIYINCEDRTESRVVRVNLATAAGAVQPNDVGPADGEKTKTVAGRLAAKRRLTPPGDVFLRDRHTAPSEVVPWESDGHTIEGVLTLPPAEVAKAPHRLIVYPHGGPHGRAARGFDFTVQAFAAAGYAVLQPNFRGSAGYGQPFIDADRYDLGGGDMRDVLRGVDQLIRDGRADRGHLFLYGTSYGGYMTTWLVGHTPQFRAAVAVNPVTDLTMMWTLSDLQSWTEWEFGGRPWEQPERYRKHSPLTHIEKVRTPTLLLHARDDRRCPLPMGLAFHRALRVRGVATELVVYPDEGHVIRQPRHREDVLRRTLAWFATHDRAAAK